VLKGIDLELPPGSRTVIVGGNGSGKSTLLRIGAGVSWPSEGTLRLPGHIGYVPERLAARTRFTGAEYLIHMGRIKGLPAGVLRARSRELIERLGLQPGPDEPVDSLSKGNRQKLVLAQAFLAAAGLLVLDEPFSGLDPVAHTALGELTTEAQAAGTAVLLSSHRPFSQQTGLRQLRIENGRLSELGMSESSGAAQTGVVEIQLQATDRASDRRSLAAIPGVLQAPFSAPPDLVVLVTDQVQTDRVLIEAIGQGWSVRSVRSIFDEGGRE
jgi:ABC-2 type transport system ATP-binding protein